VDGWPPPWKLEETLEAAGFEDGRLRIIAVNTSLVE